MVCYLVLSFDTFCSSAQSGLGEMSHSTTKPTKWHVHSAKRSACASIQSDQSLLHTQWIAKDPSFLHADSED